MPTTPQPSGMPSAEIFDFDGDGLPCYRGRPVGTLVGVPFDQVWGLLVDGVEVPGLPPAEPFHLPTRTGDTRVDVLSALAQLTPAWSFRPLTDIERAQARDNLARASALTLSFVAQSARGHDVPAVPQREVDLATTITERFLVRWRGEADPVAVSVLDTFWLAMAENGLTPSTQTVRLAAQAGADAASCLAAAVAVAGGPFLGGAVARGLALVEDAERTGDAAGVVREHLATYRTLPGFGEQAVPTDQRVRLLRDACERLDARRLEVATAVAKAGEDALAEAGYEGSHTRTNSMYWGAVLLDHIGVGAPLLSAMYLCGRTAGWSAHVLEVHSSLRG